MDTDSLRHEIMSRFGLRVDESTMISECQSLCRNYTLTPEMLYWRWEAIMYSGNSKTPQMFDASAISALRVGLSQEAEQKAKKAQLQERKRLSKIPAKMMSNQPRPHTLTNGDSMRIRQPVAATSAGPSVSFKELGSSEERKKRTYRYMYEKISERSEVLDERIDEFAELIREHYSIEDLGDPASATEEEIHVVGRICSDADSSSSSGNVKLNDENMFLETSRMMGSGARVALKFYFDVKLRGTMPGAGLGLFPGAIVALKGKNGGGAWFVVSEILGLPPLLSPSSSSVSGGPADPFTMSVACGPFTPDTDLMYKPFAKLMEKLKSEKPAVLLLLGPFVDSEHPQIKSGDVDEHSSEIFETRIKRRIFDFLSESPTTLILLVPSVRDAISDHSVYPQDALESTLFIEHSHNVKLLPNPSRFALNGVSFAVSSVDVLFHVRNQEYVKRGIEVDALPMSEQSANDLLANGCRHLFQQRSFYPLFPVPFEHAHDVNLDISHSDGLRMDDGDLRTDRAPHILIVPSKLKHFSKAVDSTLAVNPSFLTKGVYANLQVRSGEGGCSCDIVKL